MPNDNYSRITEGLQILQEVLADYIERELVARYDKEWWKESIVPSLLPVELENVLRDHPKNTAPDASDLDVALLLKVMDRNWQQVFGEKLSRDHRTWLKELQSTRNKWAHPKKDGISSEDAWRALDTIARFTEQIDHDAMIKVRKLASEVRESEVEAMIEETAKKKKKEKEDLPILAVSSGGLSAWREVATPHPDVAKGKYRQAEFAADLAQVLAGTAEPEYGDPSEFFRRTYLTEGMMHTLTSAVERMTGKGGDPVVQLKTSFGGGKTHTMLALYHLLGGRATASQMLGATDVLNRAGAKDLPKAKVAILVGTALSPAKDRDHKKLKQGKRVRTLWGEMAAQIGGDKGYDMVAADDRKGTAPGSDDICALLNTFGPCLILIDELVAYARNLYGVNGLPAGSFDSNMTFVQSLTEGVKRSRNSIVVASIPESDMEIGGEAGKATLERLENTFARLESVWKPVGVKEGFEIVRRRLFNPIQDTRAREKVCRAFWEMYRDNPNDFPATCRESRYLEDMVAAYPIHPEVFSRLYEDWSKLDQFQRTRGVLRLLASTIHSLYAGGDHSLLILPGSLPLSSPPVRDELTRYLSDGWNGVADTDIDGENSEPYRIDSSNPRFGQVQAARRVARTVFLGSAPSSRDQKLRGIEDVRIRLGTIQPKEHIAVFNDALGALRDRLSHLYESNRRFWFDLPPNLTRTVEDRAASLKPEEVREEILGRLRKVRERADFHGVHVATGPSDVSDEQEARLVVLLPDKPHRSNRQDSPAIITANEILDKKATGPRSHKNMLVFVAADAGETSSLESEVRKYLAWTSVVEDADALNLDGHQRKQAAEGQSRSDKTLDDKLHEAYCWLLVPTQEGTSPIHWEISRIGGGGESFVKKAAKKVKGAEQLITKWSPALLKMDLDKWLWRDQDDIPVKKLWEYLCNYVYLSRLKDEEVLMEAILEGVRSQEYFAYASSVDENGKYLGLVFGSASGTVRMHATSLLVKTEVARRQIEQEQQKEQERKSEQTGTSATSGGGQSGGTVTGVTKQEEQEEKKTVPKRFHASVSLNSTRLARDAGQIAEDILQHMTKLPGTEVSVRLEIQVRLNQGFPDNVIRTVCENCRTLKFDSFDFEEE